MKKILLIIALLLSNFKFITATTLYVINGGGNWTGSIWNTA